MSEYLTFTHSLQDDLLTIAATGELDVATERALVDEFVHQLRIQTVATVVLDLRGITFIDSSGLRAILNCRRVAADTGVAMKLQTAEGPVLKLLKVGGIESVFEYL